MSETTTDKTQLVTSAFDLSSLRLSQDYASVIGVKKAVLTVPVRKPHRQEFVRVHPDPEWRLETAVFETKEDQETYLVDPSLWSELSTEVVPKVLFTAQTRQSVTFLWAVRLPGADGKLDDWNRSALEAANLATKGWIRMAANRSLGAYEVFQATGNLSEPVWNEEGFQKLVDVAFKERFIKSLDHPVLRKLRGEF